MMRTPNAALKAEHIYICGDTGTGKSSTIKPIVKAAKRVLIWDPDGEYAEEAAVVTVDTPSALVDALRSKRATNAKIAFHADDPKLFSLWCDCVFTWGNCVAVAEEIADVTGTGKAAPSWGRLIRRGRKYGIKIIAVTQRPAEADKTVLANAAVIRVYALGRATDRDAVAKELSLPADKLLMVPLEYLEYTKADLSVIYGKLGQKKTEVIRAPR